MYNKQNILVVGANSFIGSNLITALKKNPANFIVGVYHTNVDKLHQDIKNISINDIDKQINSFDFVYLIGAFIPESNHIGFEGRKRLFESNVLLIHQITSLFPDAKIVLCSSVSVYASSHNTINENSSLGGINEYGISKLWGEKIVSNCKRYAIVRCSSVYGQGMKMNTFLPRCIFQAINDKEIIIYGNGERSQDYIHVSDVAEFLIKAAKCNESGIFLGVSGKSIANIEVAKIIASKAKAKITFKGIDNSPSFVYDNEYTCDKLSYRARANFEKGIESLTEWIKGY